MTDVCPGTHYCGNDLGEMCELTKISMADADPSGPHFRAGDGALLNQIVWHRGAAHRDKHALERIVFIVSFLARPDIERDPRQLSRGTYFHQVRTWSLCQPLALKRGTCILMLFLLVVLKEMEHVGPHLVGFDGSNAFHAKTLFLLACTFALEATQEFLGLRLDHFGFYALCQRATRRRSHKCTPVAAFGSNSFPRVAPFRHSRRIRAWTKRIVEILFVWNHGTNTSILATGLLEVARSLLCWVCLDGSLLFGPTPPKRSRWIDCGPHLASCCGPFDCFRDCYFYLVSHS